MVVFLHDILGFSKNEKEHEENLRMFLQVLREWNMYAKLGKCDFYQRKIHYLGHIIYEERIYVDT